MRVLTVKQPWAWALIFAGKDVENRPRNIAGRYRGPVAIHVGLVDDPSPLDFGHTMSGLIFPPCPHSKELRHNRYVCTWCTEVEPRRWANMGTIIGTADLVDVHGGECLSKTGPCGVDGCDDQCERLETCSPWADPDAWHLTFANPRPLPEPMPWRGALGLRRLPEDVGETIQRLAG